MWSLIKFLIFFIEFSKVFVDGRVFGAGKDYLIVIKGEDITILNSKF